jgi:hypothetical protein
MPRPGHPSEQRPTEQTNHAILHSPRYGEFEGCAIAIFSPKWRRSFALAERGAQPALGAKAPVRRGRTIFF